MHFEWSETKAAKNLAKHGVSFGEATLVFSDPNRLTVRDCRHESEVRHNTTGALAAVIFLTVTHTDRTGVTRIISARRASRLERKAYHAHN